jgi:hypothetical protein
MTIDLKRLAVDADYWNQVAPEGATHFMYSEKFVKWVDGVEWVFYASSERKWKKAMCSWSLQRYTDNGDLVTPKPSAPKSHPADTQPAKAGAQISAEWDGQGLPPVGWHGQCTWGLKVQWDECVILPGRGIAKHELSGWSVSYIADYREIQFRPIRSQAEREREELATFLEDYHLEMGSFWCPEKEADYILSSYDVAKKARGES